MGIHRFIDHTLLSPVAVPEDIIRICKEAIQYQFAAVCINSYYTSLAVSNLRNTDIKIASVVGFPLGAVMSQAKIHEAMQCIDQGADEIDMVINIGLLKSGYYKIVEEEIRAIKTAIGNNILKVIFENCYLTNEEKKTACKLSINAGADFIKTSTGFGTSGATLEDVQLMKTTVKDQIQIKASGGIRDLQTATDYINLGVTRIGTSSGVHIMKEGST